jgi:hypothetical protein
VLLVYSLAYAAWRQWRLRRSVAVEARPGSDADDPAPLSGRTLVGLAAGVSVATILMRLVFPILSGQIGQSHVWQWPQFVALFGLGVVAAQRGWLQPVPDRLRRGCGFAALAGALAFVALAGAMAAAGVEPDVWFEERTHWAPLALAAIEGPLAVGAVVWMLGLAQRHLDRPPGELGRALARSAYAAFILQGAVLIALMVGLRPVDLPVEVKAVAVATLGVAGSFALGWALVTRTRIGRVL